MSRVGFGAFCLDASDFNFLPTDGFSIKPLKVKLLAGEQKATKLELAPSVEVAFKVKPRGKREIIHVGALWGWFKGRPHIKASIFFLGGGGQLEVYVDLSLLLAFFFSPSIQVWGLFAGCFCNSCCHVLRVQTMTNIYDAFVCLFFASFSCCVSSCCRFVRVYSKSLRLSHTVG